MDLDIKGQWNLGEAAGYAAYDNQVLLLDYISSYLLSIIDLWLLYHINYNESLVYDDDTVMNKW